jgi:hypothetical protein
VSTGFAFDVAISFAGEQRSEAQAIADCLQSTGVSVFYDDYEAATLWGKNLYDHLASVYQDQARYCVMLVSAAYAEKVWTNHERQSAQARSLSQRTEYILPVRFDDTQIPGLLKTTSFVRFADLGAEGICRLILEKLDKHPILPVSPASLTISGRGYILDAYQKLQAWPPVTECDWGNNEAIIVVQPDDPTDPPFLDGLRGNRHELLVAFRHNVGLCRLENVRHLLKDGNDQWRLQLRIERTDFSAMEIGTPERTADQFAEERARRILLNEYPAPDPNDWNKSFEEVLRRGMQTVMQPTTSPFPAIYEHFSNDPRRFLEIAWITAAMTLKTSGTVAELTTLQLTLDAPNLAVTFSGKRHKQYANHPASTITVQGTCKFV